MIDRLQRAVLVLETLPPNMQELVVEQIEQLAATVNQTGTVRRSHAGIWADFPDDMEETLDRWRHEVPPTPFTDERIA